MKLSIKSFCILSLFAVLSGCASREEVYDEIYDNRTAAYESWKNARAGISTEEEVVLVEQPLSIADAVMLAIGNNKSLRAILTNRENAAGRELEAYAEALPSLTSQSSVTRLGERSPVAGNKYQYAMQFVLSQPIFHGGAIMAGIRAARMFSYLTDEAVATTFQQVVFDTRQAYYEVLLNVELVKVSEGDLELSKAHLSDVERKFGAGVVSQYDVLRARVEVSNVEAQLISRQNELHLSYTTLLRNIGISQESKVVLTDGLEYHPIEVKVEDAVKKAYMERSEILQAELAVRIAREDVRVAFGSYLPRIDSNFTYTYGRPDPNVIARDDFGTAWSAGIGLVMPIFDLAIPARLRQARAAYERSVVELAAAEEQVLLDVKQAILTLVDADKFVQSQSDNIERAREALRLARAGYDAGVNTELEMLDARQALSATQALYYQAVYRHEAAKLSLQRAVGSLKDERLGGLLK